MTAMTALAADVSVIVVPILQKALIERITQMHMDTVQITLLCIVSALGIAASIVEALVLNHVTMALQRKIQEELLDSALCNKNDIIESKGAGAYMVSVFGDAEHIANLTEINIFHVIFQCLGTVVILCISTSWSPLFIEIVIPCYLIMITIHIISNKMFIHRFQLGREMIYTVNPMTLEYIENRGSVLRFSDIGEYKKALYQLFDIRDGYFKKAYAINAVSESILKAIKTIALMLFFVLSLLQIMEGKMQISSFIALTSYFGFIFAPILLVKQLVTNSYKFKTMYNKIKKSLEMEMHLALPGDDKLMMENCCFSYEENDQKRLKCISFDVNCKLGIVGLSGEGKSTIIKMLMGSLDPTSGACIYGGACTSDITKYVIQTTIRYYSQDIEIFNRNLEFNITLGKKALLRQEYQSREKETIQLVKDCFTKIRTVGMQLNREERKLLQEIFLLNENQAKDTAILGKIADRLSECTEWVEEELGKLITARHYYVKEKYQEILTELAFEDILGRDFGQRGNRISGGEKNKVALARFLLPEHGKYFILDEPFTNLDALAEAECMKVLLRYSQGMKGIIISHKMNVIRDFAEEICIVEDGMITHRGTHQDLVQQEGLYHTLCDEYFKGQSLPATISVSGQT